MLTVNRLKSEGRIPKDKVPRERFLREPGPSFYGYDYTERNKNRDQFGNMRPEGRKPYRWY